MLLRPVDLKAPEIRFAVPKGRMNENVLQLLSDAGIKLTLKERNLRPTINLPGWSVKLLKPRNVVEMLHNGTRDIGFAGPDLIFELGCHVTTYFDTKLDPVKVVVAAPEQLLIDGELPKDRHLRVASEYERVTNKWIRESGMNASLVRTHGATEVFPPEDADLIVDNTATGTTLRANRLVIMDELLSSTTHLCVHPNVVNDPAKRCAIDQVVLLLKSVMNARAHALLEFNASTGAFAELVRELPALREPTVSPLHGNSGYAVRVVVRHDDVRTLVPLISARGGTDILVTGLKQLVY